MPVLVACPDPGLRQSFVPLCVTKDCRKRSAVAALEAFAA